MKEMKLKRQLINDEQQLKDTLDIMFDKAKDGEDFFDFIELMKNEQVIITAMHNIKSNRGSKTKGVDNKEINYYLTMPSDKLIKLIRHSIDNYNPKAVRRVFIPKSNGKQRPLGIPTMLDRILQEVTRIVMEPVVEAKFFKHSYGFRPYRSAEHAVARVIDIIRRSDTCIAIEGDIKAFFDNINHNKLVEQLWNMGFKDKRLLSIIKKMLKADINENGIVSKSEVGTPQGGIISPLLANVYLNNFDWMIAEEYELHSARFATGKDAIKRVKRRHEPCFLIRYADDWIILCKTRDRANRLIKMIDKYFKHVLKIELSMEKTKITDLNTERATFLGFDIFAEKARMKDVKVGKLVPNSEKFKASSGEIIKQAKQLRKCKHIHDVGAKLEAINTKIVGLSNYFNIGNCSLLYSRFDHRLSHTVYKSFSNLYGNKNYRKWLIQAKNTDNRISRHKGYTSNIPFVEVDGVKIGLTKMSFTASTRAMNFNQSMTPYTEQGRVLYEQRIGKKLRRNRTGIFKSRDLEIAALNVLVNNKPLYNFEYMMNRNYAFNRDKGKCKICETELDYLTVHCHHINPNLPIDETNKVKNLATVCKSCHTYIHKKDLVEDILERLPKLKKYRELLNKSNKK